MSSLPSENSWIRRTKWLTQALIISGTLNIGLIATFAYFALKDRQQSLAIELKPVAKERRSSTASNEQFLKAYSLLPYPELILRLENKDLIEEGLTKRDIALACLVAFHHFNLDKALGGINLQKRLITLHHSDGSESMEVGVFPGLADFQFQAVLQYARTEKWPLTSQGLFYEIKRSIAPYDLSLLEAFYLSNEFHAIQTLFTKSGLPLTFEKLIDLLCQGDWKMVADFTASQRQALDFTPDRRRAFLLPYLNHHSPIAAELLLRHDHEFVFKHLDDTQVLIILDILDVQTPELQMLAKELLTSPRTDAVHQKAATILYAFVQEPIPEPYDHQQALARFIQSSVPQTVSVPVAQKKFHTVEAGDSLWKIARKYHVTIEELMKVNHLETERLRLGKQLEIPEKKS
jgi:LysM repeat protein